MQEEYLLPGISLFPPDTPGAVSIFADIMYTVIFRLIRKILISPCFHTVEDRQETIPKLRQCILNPWRNFTKVMANNEAICLQFTKLFCKGAFCDFSDLTAKLPKASDITFADIPQKLNLIFSAQQFLHGRNCLTAIHSRL